MTRLLFLFLCQVFVLFSTLNSETTFGYISYSSYNIGDDVQALAAKRFLPAGSIGIDREFMGVFKHKSPVKTIINGWLMHTRAFCWYLSDIPAPLNSWPPSASIDPLLISIHFAEGFVAEAFSKKGMHYLKEYGPVGARDYTTLAELQKRNIPAYFSGCLSLTLENAYAEREDVIYAVDIEDDCLEYIRSKTKHQVIPITHIITDPALMMDAERRLEYTQNILEKYKRAKCVVTRRLHATMPCLAFETPVLLVDAEQDSRLDGLRELARHCSKQALLCGAVDFDFDSPSENPRDYLPIRENLIKIVTEWVKSSS